MTFMSPVSLYRRNTKQLRLSQIKILPFYVPYFYLIAFVNLSLCQVLGAIDTDVLGWVKIKTNRYICENRV